MIKIELANTIITYELVEDNKLWGRYHGRDLV